MTKLLSCCALFALVAQEPTPSAAQRVDAGITRYRAGDHAAAFAEFTAAAAAHEGAVPAYVSFDLALAALRVQRANDAETAARALLAADERTLQADGEFLLAMAALQRGEQAAAAARLPDPEPFAWAAAIRSAELAHRGFVRALQLRGEWPEALRNAERAWRRLDEWKRQRAEADAKRASNPREKEPPPPAPPAPSPQPPEEVAADLATTALAPAEVARLLQRVQQREREKQSSRQAAQRTATVAAERDW